MDAQPHPPNPTPRPLLRLIVDMLLVTLGVGLFDMPFAIRQCGLALGIVAVVSVYVVALVCWVLSLRVASVVGGHPKDIIHLSGLTVDYLFMEAGFMHREEAMLRLRQRQQLEAAAHQLDQQEQFLLQQQQRLQRRYHEDGPLVGFVIVFLIMLYLGLVSGLLAYAATPPAPIASAFIRANMRRGHIAKMSPLEWTKFRAVFLVAPLCLLATLNAFGVNLIKFNIYRLLCMSLAGLGALGLLIVVFVEVAVNTGSKGSVNPIAPSQNMFFAFHSACLNFGPVVNVWYGEMEDRAKPSPKLYLSAFTTLTCSMILMLVFGLCMVSAFGDDLDDGITNLPMAAQISFYAVFLAASIWVVLIAIGTVDDMVNKYTRLSTRWSRWSVRLFLIVSFLIANFVPFLADILVVMGGTGTMVLVPVVIHASVFWRRFGFWQIVFHLLLFSSGLFLFVSAPMSFVFQNKQLHSG